MFLKRIDLTTALRPSYLPDEVLLFVQDNVGLYEGKYKLPNQQNGQVYLTSHRICYVDSAEPREHSVALDLKRVERYDFYAGFLKSSAKITFVAKAEKRSSWQPRPAALAPTSSSNGIASIPQYSDGLSRTSSLRTSSADPSPASTATWVCTICSFSNPVPSNFDPASANAHTPLAPCLACGIKPTLSHVLKAAISNASNRQPVASPNLRAPLPLRLPPHSELRTQQAGVPPGTNGSPQTVNPDASFQCPRCTFLNHPSLLACEICGAPLISHDVPHQLTEPQRRTESPGPLLNSTVANLLANSDGPESVKISFRGGGEKIFYERLKGAMTQRKWLLRGAPPIPKSNRSGDGGAAGASSPGSGQGTGGQPDRAKTVGIAGLEQRGLDRRKNNEIVIGTAFEDLEALMASAKEVVALAESFARQAKSGDGDSASENALLAESATQLGLITTKDIVGGVDDSLYLSELARNLAEFLTDDARGVLKRAGGIISLVDLWAMFNRARGGVELVSPNDFDKAARLWDKLKLPVRLRTFKSGVMVVQSRDRTDEATIKSLLAWIRDLRTVPPDREVAWDWQVFGRGVTARDAAEKFGWSIGVAEEELEMAEEKAVLCREEGIEGLKFWENFIDTGEGRSYRNPKREAEERVVRALKESGFI